MAQDSPFFITKVECPICKTVNEFETVRVGAYVEEERDTDFCPLNIKWRFPKYDGYNPLVYFSATCENCFYTREFNNSFKDWKKDNTFRTYRLKTIKEKHLEQLSQDGSVIKEIAKAIDTARYPNESAVLKLHLAIIDETLQEHHSKLDLGRFYLRIGWIFRQLDQGENSNLKLLRGMMSDLESRYRQARGSMTQGAKSFKGFVSLFSRHCDDVQVTAEIQSQMLSHREKMGAYFDGIEQTQDELAGKCEELSNLLIEYRSSLLGGDGSNLDGFGSASSFGEFLFNLRQIWDGIAVNEKEALELAVFYYKQAFAEGREVAKGNQQIQAAYLIAELSRRVGDHETAAEYFGSTIRHGQEFIYSFRNDQSRTALARKILELAVEQGKANKAALQSA